MLDEWYQYFVLRRKGKVKDVATDAASIVLDWMRLLWERQQSLTPQKVYVWIQNGRGYQRSSRYRGNSWLSGSGF